MSDTSNFTPLPPKPQQQEENVPIHPRGVESEPTVVPVEKTLQKEENEVLEEEKLADKKNLSLEEGTEEELNELRGTLEEKKEEKTETPFGPKLPLLDEEIEKASHAPISSSLRWMATMCKYILWQSGITLVSAGGKLVRRLKKR